MTTSFVINGQHHVFSDTDWDMMMRGDMGAHPDVLRYIIKKQADLLAQDNDEFTYVNDMLAEAQKEVAELRKEQVLGWETKPAKAKRLAAAH